MTGASHPPVRSSPAKWWPRPLEKPRYACKRPFNGPLLSSGMCGTFYHPFFSAPNLSLCGPIVSRISIHIGLFLICMLTPFNPFPPPTSALSARLWESLSTPLWWLGHLCLKQQCWGNDLVPHHNFASTLNYNNRAPWAWLCYFSIFRIEISIVYF